MLQPIADHIPGMFPYCHSAYANPSFLFYGQYLIMSQEGPQQGVHSVQCFSAIPYIHYSRRWALSYDWVTWMMLSLVVLKMQLPETCSVMEVGHEVGLDLNISKRELISRPGCVVTDPTLQSLLQLPVSDAELLGVPLFIVLFLTQRGQSVVMTLPEQSTV